MASATGVSTQSTASLAACVIKDLTVWQLRVPLVTPYRLAFGLQTAFDCVIVGLTLADGRTGFGEAALLPGYTDETVAHSWERACGIAGAVAGGSSADLRAALGRLDVHAAFTACAFQTALDQALGHRVLTAQGRVPLLGTVNCKPDETGALEAEIERLLATGYRTLKVKVGWSVDDDLAAVARIQRCVAGRARMRIDGNQGFSPADGAAFAAQLDPAGIELLEQPCAAADWDAAVAVKAVSTVPVMLDEAIYGLDDIRRAAALGCADFIKLKLMKMGGIDALIEGLELIRTHAMQPVLGNGVATGLGCWMEACVALDHIDNAGEMNGFLKPTQSILSVPLRMDGADLVLDGAACVPDLDLLDDLTVHQFRAPAS